MPIESTAKMMLATGNGRAPSNLSPTRLTEHSGKASLETAVMAGSQALCSGSRRLAGGTEGGCRMASSRRGWGTNGGLPGRISLMAMASIRPDQPVVGLCEYLAAHVGEVRVHPPGTHPSQDLQQSGCIFPGSTR